MRMEYVDEDIYENHDLMETGYFTSCMRCDHICYDIGLKSHVCREQRKLIRNVNIYKKTICKSYKFTRKPYNFE